jgi:hypothetical protein
MSNPRRIHAEDISRRSALRRLVVTVGSGAILTTITTENGAAADQTKMAQKAVGYQFTPKGGFDCGNCVLFLPPGSCKVVAGKISPGAWCSLYTKQSA